MNREPYDRFRDLGVHIPTILLPKKEIDPAKWSVVACDQYTSQPEYWSQVEDIVDGSPSTLHLVLPEVYLEGEDSSERIKKINAAMQKYLDENILTPQEPGFIYVDRRTTHAASRKGLVMAVDLEKYDYTRGSKALIRATEGTVIERLPPRVKIRENAPIELPHIMLLIDDPERTVIEPLAEKAEQSGLIYDFDLMMNGGHVKGFKVTDVERITGILEALSRLADPDAYTSRYRVQSGSGTLLFAVGDGNHSLASAKSHWENVKRNLPQDELDSHPSRYALVEVVNVHDEGLVFEPIHRVVFNIDAQHLLNSFVEYFSSQGCKAYYRESGHRPDKREIEQLKGSAAAHAIPYTCLSGSGALVVEDPRHNLEVGTLQSFLDEYLTANKGVKIDYIHGEDVVASLGSKKGNMGLFLPPMDKNELFRTVILDGVLPRKTFSMGEAEEKRFYLECRKIVL